MSIREQGIITCSAGIEIKQRPVTGQEFVSSFLGREDFFVRGIIIAILKADCTKPSTHAQFNINTNFTN